jgi:hypothetical protein
MKLSFLMMVRVLNYDLSCNGRIHCIDVEIPGVDSEFFVSWF